MGSLNAWSRFPNAFHHFHMVVAFQYKTPLRLIERGRQELLSEAPSLARPELNSQIGLLELGKSENVNQFIGLCHILLSG